MAARTRTRDGGPTVPGVKLTEAKSGGSWVTVSTSYGSTAPHLWEQNSDTTMAPPYDTPHALSIVRKDVEVLRVDGQVTNGAYRYTYTNYNPIQYSSYAYCPAPGTMGWTTWKAKALANINPFRPTVDVPLFAFELREFPGMLRDIGRVLQGRVKASDVPGGHLAYEFGWKPLINDLRSLLNFQKAVSDTRNRLLDASQGRKLRRKLGTVTAVSSPFTVSFPHGTGATWYLDGLESFEETGWCTARVKLIEPLPEDDNSLQSEAFRIAFGFNLSAATIWNAIPWTWLVDWFTNFGDILEARRGMNRWQFEDMCLMVKRTKRKEIIRARNKIGTLDFSGGILTTTEKRRSVVGSDPTLPIAFSPIISGRQLGILAALVTAGRLRQHRT